MSMPTGKDPPPETGPPSPLAPPPASASAALKSECSASSAQRWSLVRQDDGRWRILDNAGRALGVTDARRATPEIGWPPPGVSHFAWIIEPRTDAGGFRFKDPASGQCIDSTTAGIFDTPFTIKPCRDHWNQFWMLERFERS